ncbi:MAG: hypothetical protein BTN85_2180 [Candidatus Methanohalarchaeum thermophilum]|uniref:Uncharacterized protein n=1 Tax=Methanohalarchaeum thermophilum TaxID=1903181 RepID=A0A1Q6DT39_METT1|nr:MAG: hypothetical protein BTN85_2180 [Candidatus Methanohalarchaeum thermophilum]
MEINETITGIEIKGTWPEIVKASEEITKILKQTTNQQEIQDWEEWRPRKNEKLEKEVQEKTIEKDKIKDSELEQNNKKVKDETKKALKDANKAIENVTKDQEKTVNKTISSIDKLTKSIDTILRKIFRTLQEKVYKKLTFKTSDQYFDNNLISASIGAKKSKIKINKENDHYKLSINIKEEDILKDFNKKIKTSF